MTVKELQTMLDKICDKNAEIEFICASADSEIDESPNLKLDVVQDDSYYKHPNKIVFFSFSTPELIYNYKVTRNEIDTFWEKEDPVNFIQ